MITGYNTDVRHGETVLHVQTEDKGVDNPYLESVIYVRGQVLAAKRTGYARLLEEGKGEKEIAAVMEHQHRTILAAIRAGRFDAKLEQVVGGRDADRAEPETVVRAAVVAPLLAQEPEAEEIPPTTARFEADTPSAPAAPPSPAAEFGPSLDQVILDYLSTEAEQEQLVLTLDGQEEIQPGRINQLVLRAFSSRTGLPIAGVQVAVKMLSTVADPRTLLVAETDDVGALELQLEVPSFDRGSAALIISGSSDLGRAEIKQLL
jgi:hypothetical protein